MDGCGDPAQCELTREVIAANPERLERAFTFPERAMVFLLGNNPGPAVGGSKKSVPLADPMWRLRRGALGPARSRDVSNLSSSGEQ